MSSYSNPKASTSFGGFLLMLIVWMGAMVGIIVGGVTLFETTIDAHPWLAIPLFLIAFVAPMSFLASLAKLFPLIFDLTEEGFGYRTRLRKKFIRWEEMTGFDKVTWEAGSRGNITHTRYVIRYQRKGHQESIRFEYGDFKASDFKIVIAAIREKLRDKPQMQSYRTWLGKQKTYKAWPSDAHP